MDKYYTLNDLISDEELYHHGIKGQKWGVRRFQNKDGVNVRIKDQHVKDLGKYIKVGKDILRFFY